METKSMKLVCFSPTGTTKAVIRGVAQGINQSTAELIDIKDLMPESSLAGALGRHNDLSYLN